ncbi:hypothetical protein [Streptomyces caeruleatus]|uniref:Uncharacterized protein n=1 Tax=Streptomyces caeruleatus TaxID=661399 RepID=A0A117RRX2_9ACTN|nr:hypothetical protein AQJ67_03630 [Streptomyces caeruleatus]
MRRTARALSVAALAGVVLGLAASAVFAEPAAEVSPGNVAPGGSVTVSVSCDPADGSAPATLDATSQAFEDGTVELKRVFGNDDKSAGPAYSGTARIPPAENVEGDPDAVGSHSAWTVDGTCPAAAGAEGRPWSATFTVARDSGGGTGGKDAGDDGGKDGGKGGGEEGGVEGGGTDAGAGGSDGGRGGVDGGQGGIDGGQGGGMEDVEGGGQGGMEGGSGGTDGGGRHCADPRSGMTGPGMTGPGMTGPGVTGPGVTGPGKAETDCADEAEHHGVRAGSGGTFTDSVPALVAGGFLIAGAAGGAVYRLRRRTPTAED